MTATREHPSTSERHLEVLARHGKSFRFASWFLGPGKRRDAALVYAFCRRIDDAVDEAADRNAAEVELTRLEQMLSGEMPPDELTAAYLELTSRVNLSLTPAKDLIAGVRSDLSRVRIESDQELSLYCYRVAGTVGLMMCGVLGVKESGARRHAIQLGMAMQLTNIARDVLEDAEMDRVYLPAQRLRRAGVDADVLTRTVALSAGGPPEATTMAVRKVVRELLAAADVTYERAAEGFRAIPWRPRFAIMVAAKLYRAIGHRLIVTQNANPLLGRTFVPLWQKILLTLASSIDFVGTLGLGRGPARNASKRKVAQASGGRRSQRSADDQRPSRRERGVPQVIHEHRASETRSPLAIARAGTE